VPTSLQTSQDHWNCAKGPRVDKAYMIWALSCCNNVRGIKTTGESRSAILFVTVPDFGGKGEPSSATNGGNLSHIAQVTRLDMSGNLTRDEQGQDSHRPTTGRIVRFSGIHGRRFSWEGRTHLYWHPALPESRAKSAPENTRPDHTSMVRGHTSEHGGSHQYASAWLVWVLQSGAGHGNP
jgi:hypothetical protein